jgi:hopene-associated glycosyltransferase HpnB
MTIARPDSCRSDERDKRTQVSTVWLLACVPGAVIWLTILLLPWRPWSTRERLEVGDEPAAVVTDDLTILIPARNEAGQITRTLEALKAQAPDVRVLLVDDRSADGTAEAARAVGLTGLQVIAGREMPVGWTGKLWALDQGLAAVETRLTLMLDSDIELGPGVIAALLEAKRSRDVHMVSLMATLETTGFWERLLLPAFVYFFKLLYPFRLSNSSLRWVAAGAGGCVLIDTQVLREVGAFSAIRDELIDDCALAARVKAAGHRTWIGLSRAVVSHRSYDGLPRIWNMVARTAFTQLRYSLLLLTGCVVALSWAFWLPLVGLAAGDRVTRIAALTALCAMIATYLPTLRFYRLSALWAGLLPLTGTLYLAMTLDSAWRYYRGVRSAWRGRVYSSESHSN